MNGKGVDINYKKAVKWLKKAAIRGNAVALHNLAIIYDQGLGTAVDQDKVSEYLARARMGRVDNPIPYDLSQKTMREGGILMNL